MEGSEFFQGGFCRAPASQFGTEKRISDTKPGGGGGGGDHFIIEDLLDFSNDNGVITDGTFDTVTGNSTDSSTVTIVDSCNSVSGCEPQFAGDIGSRNYTDAHFSSDLCVPYDDLAELEWLSNIVEESFSSEDLEKLQLISGMKANTEEASETRDFQPENNQNPPISLRDFPAKARSKRARAMPCKWTSRLLALSPTSSSSETEIVPPNSGKKTTKPAPKKKESPDIAQGGGGGDGRKCLHCATDKTPQWRTGPMGPKTLCNACGVRYKSGRLVPEYRPAASPTFVLTKHSNSHRKVLELRRQKEMLRSQHQHQHQHQHQQFLHHHQNMVFDVPNGDDYLIHQHLGPDFRHLI